MPDHCDAPIIPPKLHHATFLTLKLDDMVRWYGLVCGLQPVHYAETVAWLTNDEANHRIAHRAFRGPQAGKQTDQRRPAPHRLRVRQLGQWRDNYTRLHDHAITPFICLDLGITMSMYYADPERNGVEIRFDASGD